MARWTAPPVECTEPGVVLEERQALEAWLDFQHDTLLLKCAGLTAGQLKERAVPPSRLSLLGLVRHMTEVERWWFRMHAANTDMPFPYDTDQTGEDFEALDRTGWPAQCRPLVTASGIAGRQRVRTCRIQRAGSDATWPPRRRVLRQARLSASDPGWPPARWSHRPVGVSTSTTGSSALR
jgi:Protein of unknown function (DUF664)